MIISRIGFLLVEVEDGLVGVVMLIDAVFVDAVGC